LGKGQIVRFRAGFEEYWELLKEAEYKADYSENEIVAMSYESNIHSRIVTEILFTLRKIFDSDTHTVHDPNRPIFVKYFQAIHNPDASIIIEPSELFEYQPGMNAETTPLIVVEVLSKTTRDYDYSEKLPHYKQIPSLRQIIYVESAKPFITVYEREQDGRQWINTDYSRMDEQFIVYGQPVALEEIYRKVKWPV